MKKPPFRRSHKPISAKQKISRSAQSRALIEKFGYGYSDLYEAPSDIDSVIAFQREALEKAGEKGPYILLPHSMSGLKAIRWKQKYPDEVKEIIGLDMAVQGVYLHWKQEEIAQRIRFMKRMRSLNAHGLLFWYPLNKRELNRAWLSA